MKTIASYQVRDHSVSILPGNSVLILDDGLEYQIETENLVQAIDVFHECVERVIEGERRN